MMYASCNAWTADSRAGFETVFCDFKEAGFQGVELNIDKPGHSAHSLSMESTEKELKEIRRIADNTGMIISGISTSLWGSNMVNNPVFSAELMKKQIFAAQILGAGCILIVPGGRSSEVPLLTARQKCLSFLDSMRPVMEQEKILVGVENVWNGFFTSPFDMIAFIREVNGCYLGAYYDPGNVETFSFPEDWIPILGEKVFRIHAKDFARTDGRLNMGGTWQDITEGTMNWKSVISALAAVGYDGPVTAEVSKRDPPQSWPQYYQKVARTLQDILSAEH